MSRCSTFCHNHSFLKLTTPCRSLASFPKLSALLGLPRLVCLPAPDASFLSSLLPHRMRCLCLPRTCVCASQEQGSFRHGNKFGLHAQRASNTSSFSQRVVRLRVLITCTCLDLRLIA